MRLKLFNRNKNVCEECKERFEIYSDLINHARKIHHKTILKCSGCGKEFIHEKDRLHHSREEHQQKIKSRYR